MKMDTYIYPSHRERKLNLFKKNLLKPKESSIKKIEIKKAKEKPKQNMIIIKQCIKKIKFSSYNKNDSINCRAGKSAFWITWYGKLTFLVCFINNIGLDVFQK